MRFSSWAIARVNDARSGPAIFYFHPWEIDPDQPRVAGRAAQVASCAITPISQSMRPKLLKLLRDA